jgi:hypothetical protein
MKLQTGIFFALALGAIQTFAPYQAGAQDYQRERESARRELAPYFNKQVDVESTLVESTGPEWAEKLGPKYKLVGCPDQPIKTADPVKALSFTTAGPGPWAGAVDGINVAIRSPDGMQGGSVAYPTNSTARLPEQNQNGTKYEFFFDGTLNVRRGLIDAAIEEFDRCFSQYPAGQYTAEELDRLCPFRPVSREQQKQTCVFSTLGTIGRPLADGSGYEVEVQETTMCDFIGFGKEGSTNTSFTTCYVNSYKGVATLSSAPIPATAKQTALRAARSRMAKMCTSSKAGRRMSNRAIQQCVMRQMSKAMATAGR